MPLYIGWFLLGGLTVAIIVYVAVLVGRRRGVGWEAQRPQAQRSDPAGDGNAPRAWSWHVGALDEESGPRPPRDADMWEEYAAVQSGEIRDYRRRRPTWSPGGPRWNPYAEDQSRAHRARAARRRPRQNRPPPPVPDIRTARKGPSTYYDRLGVHPEATPLELERAYHRCVAQIHPDKFFDDPARRREAEEKLKQLNMVMGILRDPERRARYDSTLRG